MSNKAGRMMGSVLINGFGKLWTSNQCDLKFLITGNMPSKELEGRQKKMWKLNRPLQWISQWCTEIQLHAAHLEQGEREDGHLRACMAQLSFDQCSHVSLPYQLRWIDNERKINGLLLFLKSSQTKYHLLLIRGYFRSSEKVHIS